MTVNLFETVEYDQTTCTFADDPMITTPQAPTHGSVTVTIVNAPVAAGQPCAGTVFPQDLVSYTWADSSQPKTVDRFSVKETPNASPAQTIQFAATLGPVISGKTALWWFKGQNPSGYKTTQTLTAQPSNLGSYTWTATGEEIAFPGGSTTTDTTTTNTVVITSIAASPKGANDVNITVAPTSDSSQKSNTYVTTVLQVTSDVQVSYECEAAGQSAVGFICATTDQLLDQNGNKVSANGSGDLGVNETFTSSPTPDSGVTENWASPEACGGGKCSAQSPDSVMDTQLFEASQGEYMPNPVSPITPCPPCGTTGIYHFNGYFSAGGVSPGQGVKYEDLTFHFYLDHADHENISNP